jgi:hypothetical protein
MAEASETASVLASLLGRSDERDLDVDVAACRLGVRADAVGRIDQLSHEVAVDARHADVEARSQEEGIIGHDQVDLGIDRRMGRQRYFLSGGGKLDCTDKAGRPSGGEKLFRGWVRLGQLDVETTLVKHRNRRETPGANTTIVHF